MLFTVLLLDMLTLQGTTSAAFSPPQLAEIIGKSH